MPYHPPITYADVLRENGELRKLVRQLAEGVQASGLVSDCVDDDMFDLYDQVMADA